MGGPSQRPVIAPSTERQSRYRLAAHAARATPRRVAGRGRRRADRHAARESPRVGAAGVARAAPGRARARRRSPRASGPTCSTRAPAPRCAARCGSCGARSATTSALVAGRDRIALRCETDLAEFDAHVAAGRLEEAVALHRGPLLADLDDDWVLEARDEHAERLGAALARLAAAAADARGRRRLGAPPARARPARRGRRPRPDAPARRRRRPRRRARHLRPPVRPAAERARPRPVGADARAGRRAARGGGAGGGRSAAAATAAGASTARRSSGATASSPRSPSCGRRVRAGAGAVAVIGGEGGIGKTRLALELLGRARAAGARAARCTAADLGGGAAVRAVGRAAGRRWRASSTPPPADGRMAGGARPRWRRRCRCGSAAPRGRAAEVAARPRPRAAVRGGGRARRARHRRPPAGAAVRRRPPRRRADASSSPPTSRAGSSGCRCCSCSRAA